MDQSILMNANVDKDTKCGDIGYDPGELHPWFYIVHFFDSFCESEGFQLLAGIAAGFGKLRKDVIQRRKADFIRDVLAQIDSLPQVLIMHEIDDRAAQIPGHGIHDGVALRMDSASIERVFTIPDA